MGSRAASCAASSAPSTSRKQGYPKFDIRVNLGDHYASKVYTSSSPISGDVTVTTKREVPFDSIQIVLLGQTKTSFDGMSVPQEVTHTFLKMVMPIPESTYPVPRVLEPGETYTVPFNFVVPNQLTINACNHERLSDQMQDHHVLLPPSLGSWERDDMAPKMARVEYSIKARVLRDDGPRKARIMEATQALNVLPAGPEDPPLNITDKDRLYRMSKTKTLRKNILSAKLGRVTAEAVQPGPAVLSPDGRRVMSHPIARIKLSFDAASPRTLPPTVTGVSAKLTAHTYFSSGTISSFPNLGEWNTPYLLDRRGQFFTSVPLPQVTLAEQPAWTPVQPAQITRRDSGYGGSDSDSPLKTAAAGGGAAETTRHTTTLTIPLAMPTDKKTLVPTFHSCIASRVYTVQLTVSVAARGASEKVGLVVPVQVVVAPAHGTASPPSFGVCSGEVEGDGVMVVSPDQFGLPSFEEAAADEHLRPRVLYVPADQGSGGAREGRRDWMLSGGQGQGQGVRDGELPGYGEAGYRRRLD